MGFEGGSASGGIVGVIHNSTIKNSYSTGNIFSDSYSGGVAGFSGGYNTITGNVAITRTITASHEAGRIVGCIVNADSTISGNFALDTMTAAGFAQFDTDLQSYGVGKSYVALGTPTTYSNELGWGFGNSDTAPWQMPTGEYPALYWE